MEKNSSLENLPRKIELKSGICLEMTKYRIHRGRNELSDIFWYQYKIVNNEEHGIMYDNICLSLFKITEEVRNKAEGKIIQERVSQAERPNIDYKTGNIHPCKYYVKCQNNGKIQQLVLCKKRGPRTPEKQVDDNFYVYPSDSGRSGAKIHKACYYPMIEDDPNLHNDCRYRLLKEVWNEINQFVQM